MTKLEAVNYVMQRVGLHPVPSLETGLASTASNVERIIDQRELAVQSENWHYNRRREVSLTPDASSHILLADIADGVPIEIDCSGTDEGRNITVAEDRLYDLDDNTDEFDGDLMVTYVLRMDWEGIPEKIQQLIAAEASVAFNESYGQQSRQPVLDRDARRARVRARQFNSRVSNLNLLDTQNTLDTRGNRLSYPGEPG